MSSVRSHRDLTVWQKSMELAEAVFRLSQDFPPAERFGLTSQLTRAATSIPANIAEGHGRGTRRDYANFVSIARGSAMETSTLLELATRLGFGDARSARACVVLGDEVERMLSTLLRKLRNVPPPGGPPPQTLEP